MFTALLLDGSRTPTAIRVGEASPSISWGGSATTPARNFNFVRRVVREEGDVKQEVLVYRLVGLRSDTTAQAERMAEEFLYPEKYEEMGKPQAAAA